MSDALHVACSNQVVLCKSCMSTGVCQGILATILWYHWSMTNNKLACTQVLVVGGSSKDCADGGTPASAYSYRINAAAGANHAPVQETMPKARVVRGKDIHVKSNESKVFLYSFISK